MEFDDPLGLVRLELPSGWTEYPGASGLFRLAFVPWTDDAWVTVEVYGHRPGMDPAAPGPAEPTWLRTVASAVEAPPDAHVVEWPAQAGRAVFVHDDREATGHKDALVIVGPRYDVVVRGSSPSGSDLVHAALWRLSRTTEITARAGLAVGVEDLVASADTFTRLRDSGDVASATAAARACLAGAQGRFAQVAAQDGSEAARGMCALVALDALSHLTQVAGDPWLARAGELLALRTANSLRDGGLPDEAVARGRRWVSHFRRLQALLMTGTAADPDGSAAMAGIRQTWALSRLSPAAVPTADRVAMLEVALADACLRVVDARLTQADGVDGLEPSLLFALTFAVLASMTLTMTMDVEGAREADDLAIALAEAAEALPGARQELTGQGLVQALLTSAGTLTEIGDEPALETVRERLDRVDAELDALADEGALRAWACAIRASSLLEAGDREQLRQVIARGLAAAQRDPVTSAAHRALLRQAAAQLAVETGAGAGAGAEDTTQAPLTELAAAVEDYGTVTEQRNQVLLGNSLVRQADVLRVAGRHSDALAVAVHGIETLLRSAPFGTDTADAFRVAAAVLRLGAGASEQPPTPADIALRLATAQGAVASMDVRQALFVTDEGRVAADDARRARELGEEYLADALSLAPAFAFGIADHAKAKALTRLIPADPGRRAARASAVLDHLPPVPRPVGDVTDRLRAAADWMAAAAGQVLAAAGVPPPVGIDDVVRLAKDTHSLLVCLQPVQDRLVYLITTPEGTPELRVADASLSEVTELAQAVAAGLRINVVGRGDPAAGSGERAARLQDHLDRLSRLVVPPVEEFLTPGVSLIVSPYRDLWPIPFGLLARTSDAAGRRLLVDDHAISLTPSFATAQHLRARGPWRRPAPRRAFVVGDPLLSPQAKAQYLRQLAGARQEALDVGERLRGRDAGTVTVACGAEATQEAYTREAAGADLLHLACHAMLEEPATASCLFLAAGVNGDGRLTAREIPDTALDDALVVLSACETAQGRPTADGLIGIARAYLLAGARAVVASNWKVADAATAVLVGHLYDALLDDEVPPDLAHALQAATLRTREDLRAGRVRTANGEALDDRPAHWAPFVAIGDCVSLRYACRPDGEVGS